MTTRYFRTIKSSRKLALRNTILSVANAILLASCASPQATMLHETVGPAAEAFSAQHNGYLSVYSATVWTTADDDSLGHLNHTDYQVNAADGTLFAQVTNGDEEPARVTLPNGTYTIVAESDTAGTVTVPVVIESGKTTILHLEREKDWKVPAGTRGADLVRLPNGQPIGYRSRAAQSSKNGEGSKLLHGRAVPSGVA